MIEVRVPKQFIQKAKKKAQELGKLKQSILKGKGNVYGLLGELLVANYIGAKVVDTYDYDLLKGDITFDVKTKVCTSVPLPEYECSVAACNITQNCLFYTFVRVMKDFSRAWILGSYPKKDYFKDAVFCTEGTVDKNSSFGWQFKADCYNLAIAKLFPFKNQVSKKCNIVCEA